MTTLIDVARRAGVSKSTVSNVIRDAAPVATATRERVQRAISDLQYEPNVIARSLKSRLTATLGLIVPEPMNAFYAQLALGAERAAHARGYAVLVVNTGCVPDVEADAVRTLVSRRVDGVILAGTSRGSTHAVQRGLALHADDRRRPCVRRRRFRRRSLPGCRQRLHRLAQELQTRFRRCFRMPSQY